MQPSNRNYPPRLNQTPPRTPFLKRGAVRYGMSAALLLIVGIFAFNTLFGSKKDHTAGTVLASSTNAAQHEAPAQPKKVVDTSNLQASLDAIIKKYPADDTSVSVVEINSGKTFQVGDNYPFVAASTTKLLTALLFLNNVENGQESLDANFGGVTAKQLLQKMINQSDNDAWATLNEDLTKPSLNAYAKKQGLTSYDAEKNLISSNDMAQLVAKLYSGSLINKEHTQMLYGWMQNTSEERFIPASVPSNIKVYHKPGYLNDRVHDAAIIDNGSTPYVLVVYSKALGTADYDYTAGQTLFAEITKQTLTTFK